MDVQNLVFIAVIIGVFYFLVIRPQQTRARKQRDMISALKPGDEIVTIGGIYARVVSVDERVRVAVADGTEIEVAKQAIAQTVARAEDEIDEVPEADEAAAGEGGDEPMSLGEPDEDAMVEQEDDSTPA